MLLSLDDTLARKRGRKVFGVGMHHDPRLSRRKTAVMNRGHNWVVLGVIVSFPFRPGHYVSLPILFRLYVNQKTATKKRLRHRTRPELAVEMLGVLCKCHENRRFHAIGDSAYGGQSVLMHLPAHCDLTSRLGLNARLYAAAPARKPGTHGRPRKRGQPLPTPRKMLEPRTRRLTLDLYVDAIARAWRTKSPACTPFPSGRGGRTAERRAKDAGLLLNRSRGDRRTGIDLVRNEMIAGLSQARFDITTQFPRVLPENDVAVPPDCTAKCAPAVQA